MKKILILILFLLFNVIVAKDQSNETPTSSDSYIDTGEWHIAINLGYGQRSNPLVGGESQPLYILPEIAYYGDKLYFDNGDLGYTFTETSRYTFGLLTHFNYEKAYFSYIHPANLLFSFASQGNINLIPPEDIANPPTIDTISRRKYALDAGFDLTLYLSEQSLFRFQLMKDITGVYNGENAKLEFVYQSHFQGWNLTSAGGLHWKSKKLVDYYYGIDESDDVSDTFFYKGESTINPYFKLTALYPINEKWDFVSVVRIEKNGDGISNSTIVKSSSVNSFFIGASYAF